MYQNNIHTCKFFSTKFTSQIRLDEESRNISDWVLYFGMASNQITVSLVAVYCLNTNCRQLVIRSLKPFYIRLLITLKLGSVGIISTIMKYLKDNYHYTFWNISIFSLETCWTETGGEGSSGIIIFVASEEDSETNFKDEDENSQWTPPKIC